jgi:hypothetical protein
MYTYIHIGKGTSTAFNLNEHVFRINEGAVLNSKLDFQNWIFIKNVITVFPMP